MKDINIDRDVRIVMQQASCSLNEAEDALRRTNHDMVKAIMTLSEI